MSVAVAFLVTLAEIDRLTGQVLDGLGRSWPITSLMGPAQLLEWNVDGWRSMAQSSVPRESRLRVWQLTYLLVDMMFIGTYLVLALTLPKWAKKLGCALILLAAVDLIEDLLAGLVLLHGTRALIVPVLIATGIKWLAVLVVLFIVFWTRKFWTRSLRSTLGAVYTQRFSVLTILPLAVLSVLPGADVLDQLPDVQRRWLSDGGTGFLHALFSCVSVLIMATVLFVLGRLRSDFAWRRQASPASGYVYPSKPNLLIWFIGPIVLLLLLMLATVFKVPGVSWARLAWFSAIPLAVGGLSYLFRAVRRGTSAKQHWATKQIKSLTHRNKPWIAPDRFRQTVRVGDLLALCALVIGGLSLIRSFAAVVVLDLGVAPASDWLMIFLPALGWVTICLAWLGGAPAMRCVTEGGLGVMLLTKRSRRQQLLALLTPGVAPGASGSQGPQTWESTATGRKARWGLLMGSALGLLLIGAMPEDCAKVAGVIASVTFLLTCAVTLVGSLVIIDQDGGAPEALWPLRLSSAPIVILLLMGLSLATVQAERADVHTVRGHTPPQAGATPVKPTLDEAFTDWESTTRSCGTDVTVSGNTVRLRVMPLVAAEGGGIRAAYWTAATLDLLSGRSDLDLGSKQPWFAPARRQFCDGRLALFSSGASGGAVGLTVSRFARQGTAREQVLRMADSDALASGTIGLFMRDITYAATGLPLPVLGGGPISKQWRATAKPWLDRAALMESVWETKSPALQEPFLGNDAADANRTPTGSLVLNSTSVATGCRMWLTQLALSKKGSLLTPPGASSYPSTQARSDVANAPAAADCRDVTQPGPASMDVLATYASTPPLQDAPSSSRDDCFGHLNASTAALMASRFPYVTPSAAVGPCYGWSRQQIVDGGYGENTGLGTIIDLAPQWLTLVRNHNSHALQELAGSTQNSATPEISVIVPLIVYLDNGTGSDLAAPTHKVTSEMLVPPAAYLSSLTAQSDAPALLKRSSDLVTANNLWYPSPEARPPSKGERDPLPARVHQAAKALNDILSSWRKRPVVVVHQSTFPAVAAPLGWVLSKESMDTMDQALAEQMKTPCSSQTRPSDALCAQGYGSLADAANLLRKPSSLAGGAIPR